MSAKHWEELPLGAILTERRETPAESDLLLGTVPIVSKIAFDSGLISLRAGGETKTNMILARAGDLLVSGINAYKGAIAIVPPEQDRVAATIHYGAYQVDPDRAIPEFLWWMLRSRFFQERLEQHVPGGIKTELKAKRFLPVPIPLPSLAEQLCLVARITHFQQHLERLTRLYEGLANSLEALQSHFAKGLFYGPPTAIAEVGEVRGGVQKGPHRAPGANPVRYLTVAHVQRNRVILDDPRFFEATQEELDRWRLLNGDVLIIEGNGSEDQIGRTALFRGEIPDCIHQNHVIRIRPNVNRLIPAYLNGFLNSPAGRSAVQAQSRTTSGLRTLSVGRIKAINVPVPSIADQVRIIAELDDMEGKVKEIQRLQSETSQELDALLPSILHRAFRGEL